MHLTAEEGSRSLTAVGRAQGGTTDNDVCAAKIQKRIEHKKQNKRR